MLLVPASKLLIIFPLLILLVLITLIVKWQRAKFIASKKKTEANIKSRGRHIKVPFDDITIRVKKIHQVKLDKNALVSKSGYTENYSDAQPGTEQDMCCLIYTLRTGGKQTILESDYLIEDRKNLEIKLYMNKGIDVYYDLQSGDYFFDTDVLFK